MTQRRCILSDLDGTLVDSEVLASQAFLDLLPDLHAPLHELHSLFCGVDLVENIRDIRERYGVDPGPDYIERYRVHMVDLYQTRLKPFPGVADALMRIDSPICVASNSPADKIELSLDLTGLRGFFGDRYVSACDLGAWKPDPAVFLAAAEKLGFAPEDCIALEDSVAGLTAAKAAGMTVFHFDPDGLSTEPLRFSQWRELPDLLAGCGVSVKDRTAVT